jgi:hypothetical protein
MMNGLTVKWGMEALRGGRVGKGRRQKIWLIVQYLPFETGRYNS